MYMALYVMAYFDIVWQLDVYTFITLVEGCKDHLYSPLVHKFASYRVDNFGNLFIFHFPVLVLMDIAF